MWPRFDQGEMIYVNPGRPPAIGDYVVVELAPAPGERNGKSFIKKLVKRTSETIVCEQFNPPMQLEFDRSEIKGMHRVVPWNEVMGI
jgi:phage repressor protein C with HTH and peptisase S24 domain